MNNLKKGVLAVLLAASPMVGAETHYPAADFQPEIIYQDSEYIAKHKAPVKAPGSPQQATGAAVEQSAAPAAAASGSDAGDSGDLLKENAPFGLIVLALIGFMVWSSKKSGGKTGVSGETGVAKYLKSLEGSAGGSETGVAKYLKQQEGAAGGADTGVAKYLRERT